MPTTLQRSTVRDWLSEKHSRQKALAALAGISEFRLSRWLCGHVELTAEESERLTEAMHTAMQATGGDLSLIRDPAARALVLREIERLALSLRRPRLVD